MTSLILPGGTLGIVGDGQLGRMLALVARRMGYAVRILGTDSHSPAAQVADEFVHLDPDSESEISRFASEVDVITYEFENLPVPVLEHCLQFAPVWPRPELLWHTQHRVREKVELSRAGLPVTPFHPVGALDELEKAWTHLGSGPAVLKSATWGYDGKGQRRIQSSAELAEAWSQLGAAEAVLERWVDFERELSVVVARSRDGSTAVYGPIENSHSRHILDVSVCPAEGLEPGVLTEAVRVAEAVAEHFDLVGVLCVEFFLTRDQRLVINELAPRPHNSGHLTIDAHRTSQFEQQLRAVCGLPLGSAEQLAPAAMANLLGDDWGAAGPDWLPVLSDSRLHLHLYGKAESRPGRKMGHLTGLAESPAAARQLVLNARDKAFRAGRAEQPRQADHPAIACT